MDDNNYAVLTKKKDRREWEAKALAKAFKIEAYDIEDEPKKIFQSINKNLFNRPILVNIHTNRIFWHAGAGKDQEKQLKKLHIVTLKKIVRCLAKI